MLEDPYATVVGGTTYPAAILPSTETAWACGGGGYLGPTSGNSGVTQPGYQKNVAGLASSTARNVPDVSAYAGGELVFYSCASLASDPTTCLAGGMAKTAGGTSSSSPLWAGFAALINEASAAHGVGNLGFPNLLLYAMNKNAAVYASSFNDITSGNDGQSTDTDTGSTTSFSAGTGYDNATGLGSPLCSMINQIANPSPTSAFIEIEFRITTGDDDLRGDSSATATIFDTSGNQIGSPFQLKSGSDADWEQGSVHDIVATLPSAMPTTGIGKLVITLIDGNVCNVPILGDTCADNWNISAVEMRLLNGNRTPEVCDVDAFSGGNSNSIARLTNSNSSNTWTIPTGCHVDPGPTTGGKEHIEFIISTAGDKNQLSDWGDNLRGDSELNATVFFADSSTQTIPIKSQSDPQFDEDSVFDGAYVLNRPTGSGGTPVAIDHIEFNMVEHDSCNPCEGDDNWNLAGLNIVTWTEGKPLEQCEFNQYAVNENTGEPQDHYFLRMGTAGSGCFPATVCEQANGLNARFGHQSGCQ
jgi:hypothetical protein